MSYDRWKTQAPDMDGPEQPSPEQERADYEDELQRSQCEVCGKPGAELHEDFDGLVCDECAGSWK